jgi:hypothetical protein
MMVLLMLFFLLEQTPKSLMSMASKQISNLSIHLRTISPIAELLTSLSVTVSQVIIGNKAQDILRTLFIPSWQSELYQEQQNPAERRYQTIKRAANRILDHTGAPDYTWLLCLEYVCFLLNQTYNDNIQGILLQHLNGHIPDISLPFLADASDSVEAVGHIVGISEHCGHSLTYKVFNPSTQKVIHCSLSRPADTSDPNLCVELLAGESAAVHSCHSFLS